MRRPRWQIRPAACTVQGTQDREKRVQIDFWQRAAKEDSSDERRAMPEFAKASGQHRHSPDQLDAVRRAQAGKTLEMVAGF
jgi:hypothetical protein